MSVDLGMVRPGKTIYIPFATYDSNDPSASVTLTGLATSDIEIYKDGGTTQRASDSGYALLDSDGIDFDGVTGIHGFSIDLADNSTANFWEAGSTYWVVVASITVDAATVNFVAAKFEIGYPDAVLNTTAATVASNTSFTLEEGPADDNALNGFGVIVHDLASSIQLAHGVVSDYTGSSKTVTLKADHGIFTTAAGDNVSFFVPTLTPTTPGTTVDITATGEVGLNLDNTSGTLATAQFDSGFLTASLIAADAIGASELASDAVVEIRNGVTGGAYALDTDSNGRIRIVDGTGAGELDTSSGLVQLLAATQASIDAIEADTNEMQGDLANGGRLDLLIDAIYEDTGTTLDGKINTIDGIVDAILVDTGTTLPATLNTIDGIVDSILVDTGTTLDGKINTIDGIVDAILVDTGTTLDGKINTLDGIVDSILVDTAEIGTAGAGLTAIMTTAMTESYNSDGSAPTPAQALYVIMQGVTEFAIASTTKTVKKLDGSTTAYTETLNDASSPTSITRAT